MIRHAARTWIEAGLERTVIVVSEDPGLRKALDGLPLMLVENPAPDRGIGHSIALGLRAISPAAAAGLIGVCDQPSLTAEALRVLIGAFLRGRIVVARYGDHRGNPVLFDRRFFPELLDLDGDRGGQRVVDAHPEALIEVDLPEEMGRDIDRPDEWPA